MILKENIKDLIIDKPQKVAKLLYDLLDFESEIDRNKEHFWCLGLSARKNIVYIDLVSLGILDATLVHPREVYRTAIIKGAHSIITGHNHPSGDTTPSESDKKIIENLTKAGEIIEIPMLDHIIIGNDGESYESMMI